MARLRPRRRCAARLSSAPSVASGAASVTGSRRPCSKVLSMAGTPWSQVVPRIGTVERLVAEREVRHDVALDCGFKQRPLKPGRVTQMAAVYVAISAQAQPHQH